MVFHHQLLCFRFSSSVKPPILSAADPTISRMKDQSKGQLSSRQWGDIFYVLERPGTHSSWSQQGPNSSEDSSHSGLFLWPPRSLTADNFDYSRSFLSFSTRCELSQDWILLWSVHKHKEPRILQEQVCYKEREVHISMLGSQERPSNGISIRRYITCQHHRGSALPRKIQHPNLFLRPRISHSSET